MKLINAMETTSICADLIKETVSYLKDAGFDNASYLINDYNKERGYIEVIFTCNESVDYIIKDIRKTFFKNFLEVKKYKQENMTTAIITFK